MDRAQLFLPKAMSLPTLAVSSQALFSSTCTRNWKQNASRSLFMAVKSQPFRSLNQSNLGSQRVRCKRLNHLLKSAIWLSITKKCLISSNWRDSIHSHSRSNYLTGCHQAHWFQMCLTAPLCKLDTKSELNGFHTLRTSKRKAFGLTSLRKKCQSSDVQSRFSYRKLLVTSQP